ncbi:DUF397 domain-containing protein [Actinomadura formosensis]|uniref:DUF397 domain-containing protein n=1 Tax=Actinomadura formosensis TaxID=60706 RepID=UPI003D8AD0D6
MPLIEPRRETDRPHAESRVKLDGTTRVTWRKSSHSGSSGGECVEVALLGSVSAVRDSKAPEGGVLTLELDVWSALVAQIKRGVFDL